MANEAKARHLVTTSEEMESEAKCRWIKDASTHYDLTYAPPVASWTSVRTLLALTAIHKWHTVQLDYVLAFPQAPVEKEIYMEIPRGVKLSDGEDDTKDFILKLNRNVYG
jgi:hypothetical protein